MQPPASGRRRQLVLGSIGVGAAAIAAGLATRRPSGGRELRFASLADAQDELGRLGRAPTLASVAAWSWAQTLDHCAQSIEYSMSGFPQMKSALFQRTVGAAAIAVFAWRGRMTHDLAEPIPGAPPLAADAAAGVATGRLDAAMRAFLQWPGPLQPHFAYGELAKPAYERAHAMHLANHLSAFRVER
ncbi:MAG TPA: DUF1569 domain-containing protein [Caldimonas sp.]|nr:DUF1569 domain-containing protein [Caldimonas sp.]